MSKEKDIVIRLNPFGNEFLCRKTNVCLRKIRGRGLRTCESKRRDAETDFLIVAGAFGIDAVGIDAVDADGRGRGFRFCRSGSVGRTSDESQAALLFGNFRECRGLVAERGVVRDAERGAERTSVEPSIDQCISRESVVDGSGAEPGDLEKVGIVEARTESIRRFGFCRSYESGSAVRACSYDPASAGIFQAARAEL